MTVSNVDGMRYTARLRVKSQDAYAGYKVNWLKVMNVTQFEVSLIKGGTRRASRLNIRCLVIDPFDPTAFKEFAESSITADDIYAICELIIEMMSPVPLENAWWADSETYELHRPMYHGESSSQPPEKGWVSVDAVTYDPVMLEFDIVKYAHEFNRIKV